MITSILSDFSRVVLNPKDKNYEGSLNSLYKEHKEEADFNFFDHFELNQDVLTFYESLKDKISISLFTTSFIQDAPEIRTRLSQVFDKIFSAKDYNLNKKDSEAYKFIVEKLNIDPSKILYIDDQPENIKAARLAGLNAIRYVDFQQTVAQVKSYLNLE